MYMGALPFSELKEEYMEVGKKKLIKTLEKFLTKINKIIKAKNN